MMPLHSKQKRRNTSPSRQTGSSSVEFAMVVLPMTLLFVVFFEIVALMWSQMVFSAAVQTSARQIRALPPSAIADNSFFNGILAFPLLKEDQLSVSEPFYAEDIAGLASNQSALANKIQLAEYRVFYQYQFVTMPFISEQFPELFSFNKIVLVSYDYQS